MKQDYFHQFVIRSLVGNEKLQLFESIDIETLFPQSVLKESKQISMVLFRFVFKIKHFFIFFF